MIEMPPSEFPSIALGGNTIGKDPIIDSPRITRG